MACFIIPSKLISRTIKSNYINYRYPPFKPDCKNCIYSEKNECSLFKFALTEGNNVTPIISTLTIDCRYNEKLCGQKGRYFIHDHQSWSLAEGTKLGAWPEGTK